MTSGLRHSGKNSACQVRRFTLIELIAVMVILLVITVGSLAFFTDTLMLGVNMRAREVAMQKAQICVDRVRKELLHPYAHPNSNGSEITLSSGRAGSIIWANTGDDANKIMMDGQPLLDNVSAFTAVIGGDGIVQINFTMDMAEIGSDMDFEFFVTPRN